MRDERWHVWTDGSCVNGESPGGGGRSARRGQRYPGGWAAVVEHGSDGYVVRGRVDQTTNTRMELVAVIEGLRSLEVVEPTVLHTDANVVLIVKERLERNQLPTPRNAVGDQRLWLDLAEEMRRFGSSLRVEMVGKGVRPIHRRAHQIAKAEARALEAGLPADAEPVFPPTRKDLNRWKNMNRGVRLTHHKDCVVGMCVSSCRLWRTVGSASTSLRDYVVGG